MEITINVLKVLRDKTGVSVMQCKKALEEAQGDLTQAEIILHKKSGNVAEKKADRTLGAGTIGSYVHDGVIGAMVLLSSETDFVAKNEAFTALARDIAMQVAATNPRYVSEADIPETVRDSARVMFEKEIEGKPVAMKETIVGGKLKSYFRDQVLLLQPFIKDEGKTVSDLITEASQKFGERIAIRSFTRVSARTS